MSQQWAIISNDDIRLKYANVYGPYPSEKAADAALDAHIDHLTKTDPTYDPYDGELQFLVVPMETL